MNERSVFASAVRKRTLCLFVTMALAGIGETASAAFFQLQENSVSGMGSAFAGGSAAAEDASTVWYNPAGMTRLPGSQFSLVGHIIEPSFKFSKTSANLTPALAGACGTCNISGGEGGNAGENAFVPNLYYTHQFSKRLFLGVGLNSPFGLATDYEDDWVGRYHADRSEIKTVNLNVALGYKLNEQWSVGGGINYQKAEATLTQAVDYGSICALAGGPFVSCATPGSRASDGFASVEADDDTWGFNVGALWQISNDTRLGAAYRSKMKFKITGTSDVTAPNATAAAAGVAAKGIVDAGAKANVTLPATASLSAFQKLTPKWTLMADVTRTFWSDLQELRIDFDSTQPDSVTTLDLKDVNRYSVGATYNQGGPWIYRFGVALDKTPTPDESVRTPRAPDSDRKWFAVGAGYKHSDTLSFDFAYVYIKINGASINKQAGTDSNGENFLRGSLVGTYKGQVQILSAQANWRF